MIKYFSNLLLSSHSCYCDCASVCVCGWEGGEGGGGKWCVCEVWGRLFAATCSDMRDITRDAYNLQSPYYVVHSSVLLVKDV